MEVFLDLNLPCKPILIFVVLLHGQEISCLHFLMLRLLLFLHPMRLWFQVQSILLIFNLSCMHLSTDMEIRKLYLRNHIFYFFIMFSFFLLEYFPIKMKSLGRM